MHVIPPVELGDAQLLSHSVLESDEADGVVWDANATYALGVRVRRPGLHRTYVSLKDGNKGKVPEQTLGVDWKQEGSTNPWRMLRVDSNRRTVAPSPLVVVLKPGQRVQALGITGLLADRWRVQTARGFDSGWRSLRYRDTRSWSQYFFGPWLTREMDLLLELPRYSNEEITITLERATGDVECGPLFLGTPVFLGEQMEKGADVGARDFSRIERDAWGDADLSPGRIVPQFGGTTYFPAVEANSVRRTMQSLRARVAFWYGLSDPGSPYFESLAALGVCQDWSVRVEENLEAALRLNVEGY